MGKVTKGLLIASLIGVLYLIYKNKSSVKSFISPNKPTTTLNNPTKPTKPQTQTITTTTQTNQPSQQANTNPFLFSQLQQAGQQVSQFTSGMGNASMYDLFSHNYFAPTNQMEGSIANDATYSWQGWVDQQNDIRQQNIANFAIQEALEGNPNFQYSFYQLPSGGYGMYVSDANNQQRCPKGYVMGNSNICEWIGS